MFFRPALVLIFSLLFSAFAHATLFRNAYVSFELPPNWDCQLDGTEWVCVSKFAKQAKEAIIILTAKEMGPTDQLEAYNTHLKTPRSIPDKTGKMVPSKVLHVRQRQIANHPWVDSLHLGSEISSYYTRYLATVKDRLAILVTFSAHKEHYTKYSNDFLAAIESLKIVASKDILDSKPQYAGPQGNEVRGTAPILDPLPTEPSPYDLPPEPNGNSDMRTKMFALALIIGAVGFYLWRKKKS